MPAKYRLGNLDLAILTDGSFYMDAGVTFGIVPRVLWEPFAPERDDRHRLSLGLNSLLLRSQGRLILLLLLPAGAGRRLRRVGRARSERTGSFPRCEKGSPPDPH